MAHTEKRVRITNEIIKKTKHDGRTHHVLWDSVVAGLGLRIRESGRHAWVVRYRDATGNRRKALGPWTERERAKALTIPEARKEAQRVLGQVAAGTVPEVVAAPTKSITLGKLWADFVATKSETLSKATITAYTCGWKAWIAPVLGVNRPVTSIRKGDVAELFDVVTAGKIGAKETARGGGKHQANRVLATLSSLLSYAERRELIPEGSNPCRFFNERHPEPPRRRYLARDEQARLIAAMEAEEKAAWQELRDLPPGRVHLRHRIVARIAAIVGLRVVMWSAARPGEVLSARWADVDLDQGIIMLTKRKTGTVTHCGLALPPPAVEALTRLAKVSDLDGWLVPSRFRSAQHLSTFQVLWRRLRKAAKLAADLTPYSMRRTGATELRRNGVPIGHSSILLGHAESRTTERHYAVAVEEDGRVAAAKLAAHYERVVMEARRERH